MCLTSPLCSPPSQLGIRFRTTYRLTSCSTMAQQSLWFRLPCFARCCNLTWDFWGWWLFFSECFFKSIWCSFQHQCYVRPKSYFHTQITYPIFSWIRWRANLTGMEVLMFLITVVFSYSSPSTFSPILMVFLQMKTLILNLQMQIKYTSAVSSKEVRRRERDSHWELCELFCKYLCIR